MASDAFKLGDLVKDKVTGFKGVIIAKTEWLNGCVRMALQPQGLTKEGKPFESYTVDVEQLEMVKDSACAPPEPVRAHGGPRPDATRGHATASRR